MAAPLRLMIYDATCAGRGLLPGLTASWKVGGWLYGALGRFDAWRGITRWEDGLAWLATFEPGAKLEEIQFWGHGHWGTAQVAGEALGIEALVPGHPHHAALCSIRERLSSDQAVWWFRTCETFGKAEGQRFARAWTRFFGCRAAGHTYVIGPLQSGLHCLAPDDEPKWPLDEGLRKAPDARSAERSHLGAPNTISCFHGAIPPGF